MTDQQRWRLAVVAAVVATWATAGSIILNRGSTS